MTPLTVYRELQVKRAKRRLVSDIHKQVTQLVLLQKHVKGRASNHAVETAVIRIARSVILVGNVLVGDHDIDLTTQLFQMVFGNLSCKGQVNVLKGWACTGHVNVEDPQLERYINSSSCLKLKTFCGVNILLIGGWLKTVIRG